MMMLAPPIARCPHCGAHWLTPRATEPDEPPTVAVCCVACSWDGEIIAGALVPITRPAGSPAPWPLPDMHDLPHRGPGRPAKGIAS